MMRTVDHSTVGPLCSLFAVGFHYKKNPWSEIWTDLADLLEYEIDDLTPEKYGSAEGNSEASSCQK